MVALRTGAPRRVGFTAGKRIGAAVARNRAKRLLREAYRLNASKLADGYDIVVVARPEITKQPFHEVERAFIKASEKAGILLEKESDRGHEKRANRRH